MSADGEVRGVFCVPSPEWWEAVLGEESCGGRVPTTVVPALVPNESALVLGIDGRLSTLGFARAMDCFARSLGFDKTSRVGHTWTPMTESDWSPSAPRDADGFPLGEPDIVRIIGWRFAWPGFGVDGCFWPDASCGGPPERTVVGLSSPPPKIGELIYAWSLATVLRARGVFSAVEICSFGMQWKPEHMLYDGRLLYKDQQRRELVQRPDGEWTILGPGSPSRLELGTKDLIEAQRRADWSNEEWQEHRRLVGGDGGKS